MHKNGYGSRLVFTEFDERCSVGSRSSPAIASHRRCAQASDFLCILQRLEVLLDSLRPRLLMPRSGKLSAEGGNGRAGTKKKKKDNRRAKHENLDRGLSKAEISALPGGPGLPRPAREGVRGRDRGNRSRNSVAAPGTVTNPPRRRSLDMGADVPVASAGHSRGSEPAPGPLRLVPRPVRPRGSMALAVVANRRPASEMGEPPLAAPADPPPRSERLLKSWSETWVDSAGQEWLLTALDWKDGTVYETWSRREPAA